MAQFDFDFLNKLIKENDVSNEFLSDLLEIKLESVKNIIQGKRPPSQKNIKKLAEYFKIHPKFFTNQVENVKESEFLYLYENTSRYIWNLLKDTYEFDFSIREETITETSLLKIRKAIPNNFFIDQISQRIENQIGGDWEWFIIKDNKWLAFRIQAKKLTSKKHKATYESLHYPDDKKKPNENQCQTLILDSWKKNRIPLYCFYNYLTEEYIDDTFKPKLEIKNPEVKSSTNVDFSGLGWTFCFADHLCPSVNFKKDNNFIDILKFIKNFKSMFDRDLEKIIKDYNDINRDDNDQGGSGGGNDPDPLEPNTDTPNGAEPRQSKEIIDEYLNKKIMNKNEFLKLKKLINIEVKVIDELPIYAKDFLQKQNVLKFAKYDGEKEDADIPFVVYSILSNHPDTSNIIKRLERLSEETGSDSNEQETKDFVINEIEVEENKESSSNSSKPVLA